MEQGPQPMLAASVRKIFDPEAAESLALWCENNECSIDLENSLIGGHTEAKLAVVSLQDSKGSRTAVLKHCPVDAYLPSRDFLAFKKASRSGPPGFADSHLVGLDEGIHDPISDGRRGQFLIIKYLGPGPLRHYNTLADLLDRSTLGPACEIIMPQILIEWNNESKLPAHKREGISAREFLREILGTRCDVGGYLRSVIENLTEEQNQDLRWPLAAVTSGEGIDHVRMKGLRGNAHGDLHPDNVFIPMPNTGESSDRDYRDFALIDLTTFKGDRLLATDPAHLVISIIARMLPDLSPRARIRLEGFVLDPDGEDPAGITVELAAAIKAIHDTGTKFADKRSHYKTWALERLAAIAACALLFVGRAEENEHRLWFLQLAAEALKRLNVPSSDPPGRTAMGYDPPERQDANEPPADQPGENALASHDHQKPDLRLLQGGAAPSYASPADDATARTCINLVDELIREIRGLSDYLSPGDAETATTIARVITEELAEALDDLCEQPAIPHISYITAIGIARVNLDEVMADLQAMRDRGINPPGLRILSAKAEQLLRCIIEIEKTGNPNQSPSL